MTNIHNHPHDANQTSLITDEQAVTTQYDRSSQLGKTIQHQLRDIDQLLDQDGSIRLSPDHDYKNQRSVITFQCGRCGKHHKTAAMNIKAGKRCPACGKVRSIKSRRKSYASICAELRTHGLIMLWTEEEFSEHYGNNVTPIPLRCAHGHAFSITWSSFKRLPSCPECRRLAAQGNRAKEQLARIDKVLADTNGRRLSPDSAYKNQLSKIRHHCGRCGGSHETTAGKLITGNFCRISSYDRSASKRRISFNQVQSFAEKHGFQLLWSEKDFSDQYRDQHTPMPFSCADGHQFAATWGQFSARPFCRKCHGRFVENFVRAIVEDLFTTQFEVCKRPPFLEGLELDLYNEPLKLAIEVDGPQHYDPTWYQSEETFLSQLERDVQKDQVCARLGITLIRIDVVSLGLRLKRNPSIHVPEMCRVVYEAIRDKSPKRLPKSIEEILVQAYERYYVPALQGSYYLRNARAVCKKKGYQFIEADYHDGKLMIQYRCPEGHIEQQTQGNMKNHGCPACYDDRRGENRRLSAEQVQLRMEHYGWKLSNSEAEKYINNTTLLNVSCQKCNHTNKVSLVKCDRGCPACRKQKALEVRRKKMLRQIDNHLGSRGAVRVSPDTEYVCNTSRLQYQCQHCKKIYKKGANKILSDKRRRPCTCTS